MNQKKDLSQIVSIKKCTEMINKMVVESSATWTDFCVLLVINFIAKNTTMNPKKGKAINMEIIDERTVIKHIPPLLFLFL